MLYYTYKIKRRSSTNTEQKSRLLILYAMLAFKRALQLLKKKKNFFVHFFYPFSSVLTPNLSKDHQIHFSWQVFLFSPLSIICLTSIWFSKLFSFLLQKH